MTSLYVAILAGGASTRMGVDKASLMLRGETLLERTVRIASEARIPVLVVGRPQPPSWASANCQFILDDIAHEGPLGGICAALTMAAGSAILVLPCDLPALSGEVITWMVGAWKQGGRGDGMVAQIDGRMEPLFCIYAPQCLPAIKAALLQGQRSCWRVIRSGVFMNIQVPRLLEATLLDCDTPSDWQVARR